MTMENCLVIKRDTGTSRDMSRRVPGRDGTGVYDLSRMSRLSPSRSALSRGGRQPC